MKKLMLILGLVMILIRGMGFGTKVQAGIVSREEVLFMEIPAVVPVSKKVCPAGKITKEASKEHSSGEIER